MEDGRSIEAPVHSLPRGGERPGPEGRSGESSVLLDFWLHLRQVTGGGSAKCLAPAGCLCPVTPVKPQNHRAEQKSLSPSVKEDAEAQGDLNTLCGLEQGARRNSRPGG